MVSASRPNETNIAFTRREPIVEETNIFPERFRRISWGAIFAGIAVALVSGIALNMLGLSIGANSINPMTEANPIGANFDTAAVVWMGASVLLSLFAGGWVAGRLAGNPDDVDGTLHGLVTWAVVTLITLLFVTSSLGSILSGVTNVASRGISLAGQGVSNVAPEVADALDLQSLTMQSITQEARSILRDTNDPALQPGSLQDQADQAGQIAQNAASDAAQTPTLAQLEFQTAIRNFLNLPAITESDRQDIVNVIVDRTNLTEDQARQTLNRWETAATQAKNNLQDTIARVGQDAADTIAVLSGVLFAVMLLGAFAAGAGGLVGAPRVADPRIADRRVADRRVEQS